MSSQLLYQRVLRQWWSCIAWNCIVFKLSESQLTSPVQSETSSQLDTDLQLEVRSRTVLNQEYEGGKLNKVFLTDFLNLTLMKRNVNANLSIAGGWLWKYLSSVTFTSWKSLNECLNSLLWQGYNSFVCCFVTRNCMKLFHSRTFLLANSTSSKSFCHSLCDINQYIWHTHQTYIHFEKKIIKNISICDQRISKHVFQLRYWTVRV